MGPLKTIIPVGAVVPDTTLVVSVPAFAPEVPRVIGPLKVRAVPAALL
jgi:hypothetical protein